MEMHEDAPKRLIDANPEVLGLEFGDFFRLLDDFVRAREEDGCTACEYFARIGKGNLRSYLDCLR